jgi:hypothetical protein
MLRCSSCSQARWVYFRFGRFSADLEWLTGWIPYECRACGRRGWLHSQRTPPAVAHLRRALPPPPRMNLRWMSAWRSLPRINMRWMSARRSLPRINMRWTRALRSRLTLPEVVVRLPPGVISRVSLSTVVVVFAFALGVGMGAVLFSRSMGVGQPAVAAADRESPAMVEQVSRDAPATEPSPVRAPLHAAGPTVALPPAALPPVAEASVESPATVTLPDARPASPRDVRRNQRTRPAARPAPPAALAAPRVVSGTPPTRRYHGSLVIRSEPPGAVVAVDGRVVGATPILLETVPIGSRVVRIESEGYEPWSFAARVVANQETRIVATLQRGSSLLSAIQ